MDMQALFTGAHVSRRPINLGGVQKGGSDDVISRARRAREERESTRRKEAAAAHVQRVWRGRNGSRKAKEGLRNRFDRLGLDSFEAVFEAASLLTVFFDAQSISDIKRAAAWSRSALSSSPTPHLFAGFSKQPQRWPVIINKLCLCFLRAAPKQASSPQLPLLLEITRMLCDQAYYTKYKSPSYHQRLTDYLARHGALVSLQNLIEALPESSRSNPLLPPSVNVACSIVKTGAQDEKTVQQFFERILAIERLTTRVPPASVNLLSTLPYDSLLQALASSGWRPASDVRRMTALLANLIALTRTAHQETATSKALVAYLSIITTILHRIPSSALQQTKEEAQKSKEIVIHDSDSESSDDDEALAEAQARVGTSVDRQTTTTQTVAKASGFKIDPTTYALVQSLASREQLSALLAASNRFSASSRPAFASFVVALLQTFPNRRDIVLNTIMFGAGERGGGVLREIWRGYIRSGPLGRKLAQRDRTASQVSACRDATLASDWPLFVLLTEMYSRALLTMGDDEFFGSKNPLTLDEVTGFSAMLRNLAFSLYWQEGLDDSEVVAGTRLSPLALRSITTTLLQQIYARDSRKQFTPQGHWLMISEFDLASFIQTVVYEDQKLDQQDQEDVVMEDASAPGHRPQPHLARLALSKKQMAFVSPRLGVLNNIPFVIPFENRVAIFRQFVQNDRVRLQIDPNTFDRRRRYKATVRRNHVSEDSFKQLNGLGAAIKFPIEIAFIDEHGLEEAGIDGGGLFKELLTSLSKEAFDTDRGLWLATKEQELYPNPHSYAREPAQLAWYSFIGRILGKALYEGILIDVRFASFFLAKWLGRQSYLDDLASLDPELYNGLIFLKNYAGNVEKDLSLNFTITEEEFGVSKTIDLIPNGSEIPVTNDNRIQYIYMTSHYRLNRQIEKQCAAFFDGLSEIIPERFLRLFNQDELRVLVGGVDRPVDIDDLQAHTVYGGFPGDEANETVRMFWDVVRSFDAEERAKLVKFATSCARPPLLGFRELNPFFALRAAGDDESRLPSSSTCVNLLKLPMYKDKRTLKEKLLYAINSGAGFDLS